MFNVLENLVISICSIIICGSFINCGTEKGQIKDDRDGNTYQWATMKDGKKWMTENMRFDLDDSYCYDDLESNCLTCGRLYSWKSLDTVCPKGWRVPTDDDWWVMTSYYGKSYNNEEGQEINNSLETAGVETYAALKENGTSPFSIGNCGMLMKNKSKYFPFIHYESFYWADKRVNEDEFATYATSNLRRKRRFSRTLTGKPKDVKDITYLSCRCVKD